MFLFYLSGYLTCCFLTPRQADISGIFCSAEIFTTSLHQGRADFPVILAAQLLFVFFVLREEFAFLFQTFSRSDPPGKAPLTRGCYVLKKEKEKRKKEKEEETASMCVTLKIRFQVTEEHLCM